MRKFTRRSASEQAITPRFSFESEKYARTGACEYREELNRLPQSGGIFLLPAVAQRPTTSFSGKLQETAHFPGTDGLSATIANSHSSTPFSGVFVSTETVHPGRSV